MIVYKFKIAFDEYNMPDVSVEELETEEKPSYYLYSNMHIMKATLDIINRNNEMYSLSQNECQIVKAAIKRYENLLKKLRKRSAPDTDKSHIIKCKIDNLKKLCNNS